MIDSFVLLAPIYLLGVIALVGFVGCGGAEFTSEEAPMPPQAPTNAHGTPGDGVVTLFWDPVEGAIVFEIDREISPPGIPPAFYTNIASIAPDLLAMIDGSLTYEDHDVVNGLTYHYVVRAVTPDGTSENSADIEATPKSPFGAFVTLISGGTPRVGEEGWFGFAFVAVAPGVTVRKLGRFYRPSHDGTHEIMIIEGIPPFQVRGTATVTKDSETIDGFLTTDALSPPGFFRYGDVKPPVDLTPGDEYYVVSHEALGGDDFLTQDAIVTTRTEATVTNAIDSPSLAGFTPAGGPGHTYGPVDFQY